MLSDKQYEESTLLALLADDSEYAFQLIFDRYRNHVYKVAVMYIKSPALAEEIVQDIFLKLWFQRKNLTGIQSLEAWLYTITKNFVLNAIKKTAHEWMARERWLKETAQEEDNTDHKVRTGQYQQLLEQAISQLPRQQRLVYQLGKEQYLSYEEIARQLSVSPLTVKTHMARALEAIRIFLKQNGMIFTILFLMDKKL